MGNLRLLLPLVILTGCAGITNSAFDPIEASRYSDIAAISKQMGYGCARPDLIVVAIPHLASHVNLATSYSSLKLVNTRVSNAGVELQKLTDELVTRYTTNVPSEGYCKLKLEQISVAAESIARSIGKKEE